MDDATQQVTNGYQWILGRDPDPDGLAYHAQAWREGRTNAAHLRSMLLASPEFLGGSGLAVRSSASPEDRGDINAIVVSATQLLVQTGPFAGTFLLSESARGDGDITAKLLGCYEAELHPAITEFASRPYEAVIDIGCAEGYYTVGLARLLPGVPSYAFDTDHAALAILRRNAAANKCLDQIIEGDFCDSGTLKSVLERHPRSLVVIDCEGYEKTLFSDPATNAATAQADLIIECHDLWDADITPSIIRALDATHLIERIPAGGRNPNAYPSLASLSDWDRWRAICERRAAQMHWLVCRSRRSAEGLSQDKRSAPAPVLAAEPPAADPNAIQIRVIQTCDGDRYRRMLDETSKTAREFCRRHGLDYEAFIGIKRGFYPAHAAYNRIPWLLEILEQGYRGWVLYMDADAYVYDLDFDIRRYLAERADRAAVVASIQHQPVPWHVNSGVLLINLGHPQGRELVRQWHDRFSRIDDDTLRATRSVWDQWNDQLLLYQTLDQTPAIINKVDFVDAMHLNHIHARFIRQYLGAFDQDLARRTDAIAAMVRDVLVAHDVPLT